jgi:tetraacyldisaccharide 4'-kinase
MNRAREKIQDIMTHSGKAPLMSVASVLHLISIGYAGIQKTRAAWYRQQIFASKQLPCKVISIGNITVGGTGKTPMTMYVAERLKQFGYRVAVLSRGYRGGAEHTEKIVCDGRQILSGPESAGDEPYLHASRLLDTPVIVGKNRYAAGTLAINTFHPDVIILDDGFQHMQLARDIDLVLLDYRLPFGNSYLLPRGTLREPLNALERADAFILTRSPGKLRFERRSAAEDLKSIAPHCPTLFSSHTPYFCVVPRETKMSLAELSFRSVANLPDRFARRRALAFSGIGRNNDFRKTVEAFPCHTTRFISFADHHLYSDGDIRLITRTAEQTSAELIITTEKDYARLGHRTVWPVDLMVIGVEISFGDDGERFDAFLKKRLSG